MSRWTNTNLYAITASTASLDCVCVVHPSLQPDFGEPQMICGEGYSEGEFT